MKRFTAFLLSLMLLFALALPASAAKMVQTFEYSEETLGFSIYIPGDWIIDTSSAHNLYGALDLGMAYSPDERMSMESRLYFYSDWAYDSLWNNNPDDWTDYVAFITDDLKDENPVVLDKIYADRYPGILLKCTSEYGSYLYGEFLINAYAYGFKFWLWDADGNIDSNISEDDIELVTSILTTFSPKFGSASQK